ncbi:MAG: 30S ribosomal protein S12 methylthiotransferase RimO [Christensenellaceae bacterium]|jgi:ribosomal protein S12 methylthiotransferase|nr:30S ribosomal protein S12 methylthiotransferase RimO [Christensenellaceae bacterium]
MNSKRIGMVSLGCDKNRMDSENILYSLSQAGYLIVNDPRDADYILINTCAFIKMAKKESIDTILEFIDYKKSFGKKIIVTGCLAERYGEELAKEIPEVDVFIGINKYHDIVKLIESSDNRVITGDEFVPYDKGRILTTPKHYAYIKIAEGCNNCCSYCAIPSIRGRYRSEPIDSLIKEASNLHDRGVKELILVAQDITRYGSDLSKNYGLKNLLKEFLTIGFSKIRLMYAYPELIDDGLLDMISTENGIAKYIDIPLQHADDAILKRMNRRSNNQAIYKLINKIRMQNPEIAIRSTFIVGFPSENEAEFNTLRNLITDGMIDYAGFFEYSREENTPAAKMPGQISKKTMKQRSFELSRLQSGIIEEKHKRYKNKAISVLCENYDVVRKEYIGRNEQNAPEVDTNVYFTSERKLEIGEYYQVKILNTGFNLNGKVI